MTVLYRAVWSDAPKLDETAHLGRLRGLVSDWVYEDSDHPPLADGREQLQASQGRTRSVDCRTVTEKAFEVTVSDRQPQSETVWTTVIRIVADAEGVHTLVENRMVSDDFTLRVSVGRPKIVRDLINATEKAMLGMSALLTEVQAMPAEAVGLLVEILTMEGRTLPVIVCSQPDTDDEDAWLRRAERIAARTEGIATVLTIDRDAVREFSRRMRDLAIWGGGIRVYAPVPVSPNAEGWRHRYFTRSRLDAGGQSTIDKIVYSVAQLSTRRRVPDSFAIFTERADHVSGLDGMVSAEELAAVRDDLEFEVELARDEASEMAKELARTQGHLSRLKEELSRLGLSELMWGTMHEVEASIPDEVQDVSEAVLAAESYLGEWLSIPESAPQELDDIDTAETAFVWGNSAWRGLRALASYAQDRGNGWEGGGFWEWCLQGPALGWPATPKKLSMTESETVQKNPKLREARRFKVDEAVSPAGRIVMLSHLKIAEGGGNLAPRIYFHDDTGGQTGRIHVGLIGPHYLVPNRSTN